MVLLSRPRATLGQRKYLINSITPISNHQLSGKTTQTHYTGKQNSTHQGCLTPRMVWAVSLFPGTFPDVADPTDADAGRTDVSVDPARRKVRTAADLPSWRRRRRPRRRSTALRLSLQPPLQRQRRHDSDTSRRSRFPISSRPTDRLTLQLLLTTATSTLADVPWVPVSSGGPMQHPAFSGQQRTGIAVPS